MALLKKAEDVGDAAEKLVKNPDPSGTLATAVTRSVSQLLGEASKSGASTHVLQSAMNVADTAEKVTKAVREKSENVAALNTALKSDIQQLREALQEEAEKDKGKEKGKGKGKEKGNCSATKKFLSELKDVKWVIIDENELKEHTGKGEELLKKKLEQPHENPLLIDDDLYFVCSRNPPKYIFDYNDKMDKLILNGKIDRLKDNSKNTTLDYLQKKRHLFKPTK